MADTAAEVAFGSCDLPACVCLPGSASDRFVIVQVAAAAAAVGAEAVEEGMEAAAVEEDMEVVVEATAVAVEVAEAAAAAGSVAEDEVVLVVEVAEAVAGAGVDVKATGFALTRGAFSIACSSIVCWTRLVESCYSIL